MGQSHVQSLGLDDVAAAASIMAESNSQFIKANMLKAQKELAATQRLHCNYLVTQSPQSPHKKHCRLKGAFNPTSPPSTNKQQRRAKCMSAVLLWHCLDMHTSYWKGVEASMCSHDSAN